MKWDVLDNSKLKVSPSRGSQRQKFPVKGIPVTEYNELVTILLKNRGILTKEDREVFIHPRLEDVTLDAVGIDAKQLAKTLKRLFAAIKKKERIIIFGDYDVDGITGTAILWETLHGMQANVMPYIPNRMSEGYGLSVTSLDNLLVLYPDTKIIVTVDNGIVAQQAVAYANSKNIEVIITDHHVPHGVTKKDFPDAYAIVHTTKLCGAGVAYLLAKELQVISHKSQVENDTHLELATLGTVADLVPLTGANRTIVKYGLKALRATKRHGLLEIFKQAACDASTLGVYEIGHIIAPRLNAAGRLSSAMDSLRLVCTTNKIRAEELADLLGATNKERQNIMTEATIHASNKFKTQKLKKILFIADASYQQGIIGLVAGRLVEEYYRPAIVIAKGEKLSKASVRSVSGFNIIEFLRNASDLLVDVGGHPMAAGFTVETEKIGQLQQKLEKMAEEVIDDEMLTRRLRIDCELSLHDINTSLYHELQVLAPFGMGNPEPTFVSRGIAVHAAKAIGKERNHLKLVLSDGNGIRLDAIAFRMGERLDEVNDKKKVDIVYTIDENTWNGNTNLQLKVKDIVSLDPF